MGAIDSGCNLLRPEVSKVVAVCGSESKGCDVGGALVEMGCAFMRPGWAAANAVGLCPSTNHWSALHWLGLIGLCRSATAFLRSISSWLGRWDSLMGVVMRSG